MPGTFVDSYSKAARVYVIVPLGTPDRIQESWDTTLRHTSRRQFGVCRIRVRGSVSGSSYLNIGNVTLRGQVHPVSLIQLRPDHIVQVSYLVIFPNQRRCIQTISQGMTQYPYTLMGAAPVKPSLECALIVVTTRRNMFAGTT